MIMPIDIQERLKKAQEQAAANDRANIDATRNITPGLRVSGSNTIAPTQSQQNSANEYDGLFGTLRGVGESALSGIRSANEALAGWLADFTPDAVKENISLVDVDADAARAAASAAAGAMREQFGRTEESREQGRGRQQQATDYLTQRRNELDTGADVERLFQEAANSQEEAARIREYTVGDSGAFAQLLFDAGVGGVQMGYDALMNFLIPGSGLASAGLRGAGSGILEAQQSGASTLEQLAYGLGVGAIEAATEKISNLAGPLRRVFGGGVADRAVSSLVNRLTSSTAGRAVLNLAANAAGEGFEEFVSSAANPVLRRIFDENALAEYGDPQMWADAAYDALVGATIGGVLGLPGTVTTMRNRSASQNATEAPTAGAVPQTGVDTSTGVNPVEAGIDASVRLFNEGGGVIDAQTPGDSRYMKESAPETIKTVVPSQSEARGGSGALTESAPDNIETGVTAQDGVTGGSGTLSNDSRPDSGQSVNSTEIPNSSAAVNPEGSLGAAPAGFDRFSAALERYGEMPERGTGAREVSIPRAMNDDSVVPQTVQTFANAEATPETTYTDITRILEQGGFNRAVITDRASLGRAEQTITDKGFQQALIDWTATMRSGRVSKDTTTLGLALYNNAINSGDTQTGIQILTDIVDNARTAAQATQAMSILNKLTPEGRLYGVQRSIANLQDEINNRLGDRAPEIHIDETLADNYLNAADEDARLAALDEIYKDIANQVSPTWYDKLNAWRYFAMLANPRTHIRNSFGNLLMRGVSGVRDRVSGRLQSMFIRNRNQRTRSNLNRTFNAEDSARYKVGYDEYKRVSSMIADAGKYQNELSQIRKHMQPLRGIAGKLANANSAVLEWEDMVFSRGAYARSLAQFLKARNITAEQYVSGTVGQEVIAEAQAYAIREAQRQTFRDFNQFSDLIQRIATAGGNTGVGRAWQTIVGSVMPFTRTPANIIVRGVAEYSPMGLLRGIKNMLFDVRSGRMTAGEAVDMFSSGLVGTGLMALGALLSRLDLVNGGEGGDEQEQAYNELTGFQPYSLNVDGGSYTLDWLAPAALPFFVGVEIEKLFSDSGDEDGSELLSALGSITQPMLEMSMLSGISDLLDSVSYARNTGTDPVWAALSSAATNYISQYFPSVFGALERTLENQRYSSYTDPNSPIPSDFQYALSQAANRIPGVEYNQVPYIDAWGNTEDTGSTLMRIFENFVSPGYYSETDSSRLENELLKLYESTGEAVIPERVTMSTKVDGERLTPEDFEEYARTLGQTQEDMFNDLASYAWFDRMSDDEKVEAVQNVQEFAKYTAAEAIGREYHSPMSERATNASEQGIDALTYLMMYSDMGGIESDKDENGETIPNSKKDKIVRYINSQNLTPAQKDWLYLVDRGYSEKTLSDTPWH